MKTICIYWVAGLAKNKSRLSWSKEWGVRSRSSNFYPKWKNVCPSSNCLKSQEKQCEWMSDTYGDRVCWPIAKPLSSDQPNVLLFRCDDKLDGLYRLKIHICLYIFLSSNVQLRSIVFVLQLKLEKDGKRTKSTPKNFGFGGKPKTKYSKEIWKTNICNVQKF